MTPFRPRWPLLVSEDTKRELLEQLAEMVHTPRPAGPEGAFARGYETGMASVMLTLGINEAASPERRSLPVPADQGTLPQWAEALAADEIELRQRILEVLDPILDEEEATAAAAAAAVAIIRPPGLQG